MTDRPQNGAKTDRQIQTEMMARKTNRMVLQEKVEIAPPHCNSV